MSFRTYYHTLETVDQISFACDNGKIENVNHRELG